MKLLAFPSRSVLEAVRALEANQGPLVDGLAASVVILALNQGKAVPPWTFTLLIAVMLRSLGSPLARSVAGALAEHVDDLEVVVVGLRLAEDDDPNVTAIGNLLLSRVSSQL